MTMGKWERRGLSALRYRRVEGQSSIFNRGITTRLCLSQDSEGNQMIVVISLHQNSMSMFRSTG